jgi:urease accessory protein
MTTEALLGLLQFTDGLFPAGGHAHSFGLETQVLTGAVTDAAGLRAFLAAHLAGSAGPCDAVIAVRAGRAAGRGDLDALLALDARADAQKPARELREASRQMGRQTLRVAAALLPSPVLAAFFAAVDAGATPGHHPVVFGALGPAVGASDEEVAAAFLHSTAVVVVNAALRLLPLGQMEGQRLLRELGPRIASLARAAADPHSPEPWAFAPGLEIAAMRHERLDGRLFRS